MESFILPEKWAIKQNHEKINEWFNENKQTASHYSSITHHIFHYPMIDHLHLYTKVQKGYIEISFEEFEIYVLKTKQYTQDNELNQILIKLLTE